VGVALGKAGDALKHALLGGIKSGLARDAADGAIEGAQRGRELRSLVDMSLAVDNAYMGTLNWVIQTKEAYR
jgi:hypothetical protein